MMHPATQGGHMIARAIEEMMKLPQGAISVQRSPVSSHTWFFATPRNGAAPVSTELSDYDMANDHFGKLVSRIASGLESRLKEAVA